MARKSKRAAPAAAAAAVRAVPEREVRPLRWVIAALLLLTAVAGVIRLRHDRQRPTPARSLTPEVHAALSLGPVLAAETAVREKPDDKQARLSLAEACEQTGDPVGAALALYPVRGASAEAAARFAGACVRAGWLDEAADALPAGAPAALRLDLAEAWTRRGEKARAAALLEALERESASRPLEADAWLNGATTWLGCRRPERAAAWAERGVEAARQAGAPAEVLSAARLLLARSLLAGGQPERALQALPEEQSASPTAEFWRARAELHSADPALRHAGMDRMARLADADPENSPAAFEAGQAALLAGQPGRAVQYLRRAAEASYQQALCWGHLARAFREVGYAAQAEWMRGRWLVVLGRFEEAASALREAVRQDSESPGIRMDLARALLSIGKGGPELEEALAALEEAERLAATAGPERVDVGLLRASVHFQREHVQAQHEALQAAAGIPTPRAAAALVQLGKEYLDSQQFDRAIEVLRKALGQEESAAAHLYLGQCYARKPEDAAAAELAVRHLLRAAALQPDLSPAWSTAAAALLRMGHAPEAAACFRRAIRWDPDVAMPYLTLARQLKAEGRSAEGELLLRLYEPRRDRERSRAALSLRADRNASDPAARLAYGELLLREGRPEKALRELLVASSLRPDWRQAHARLADVCALLDYPDMLREAERRLKETNAMVERVPDAK